MRRRIRRPSPALLLAAAALAIAVTGGATIAIGQGTTLKGCVDRSGTLRLLVDASNPPCTAAETAVEVGSGPGPQGPAGPVGPLGQTGPAGPAGDQPTPEEAAFEQATAGALPPALIAPPKKPSLSRKQRLALQPENPVEAFSVYRDQGKSVAPYQAGKPGSSVASLVVPPGRWVVVAKGYVVIPFALCVLQAGADYDAVSLEDQGYFATTIVHRFSEPGQIVLRCSGREFPQSAVGKIKLTAIEVGKLTNSPA